MLLPTTRLTYQASSCPGGIDPVLGRLICDSFRYGEAEKPKSLFVRVRMACGSCATGSVLLLVSTPGEPGKCMMTEAIVFDLGRSDDHRWGLKMNRHRDLMTEFCVREPGHAPVLAFLDHRVIWRSKGTVVCRIAGMDARWFVACGTLDTMSGHVNFHISLSVLCASGSASHFATTRSCPPFDVLHIYVAKCPAVTAAEPDKSARQSRDSR